ncbi:MAG TPA: Asp-tRNA(Asn)/Glu-tRNA(Gln) amidotransferase subunit GatB [Chitinophagaceae bacterium]|nr:Asp-tRNA(Asn)/Glu-tRNA(Gln) amidotransferase subunit GatB [Chitinophagaceae bacterium]
MSLQKEQYEIVVGLEVHAQLLTESKLFASDSAAYGGEPNTHISAITLGLPGTLPRLNKKAIEFAIRIGLACNSEIERKNYFARKHYFYPDLPKGYQITQHETPICIGGNVTIRTNEGEKKIRLHHIHLEEDAGKSLHDVDADFTCIDLNRAGVPLIEIVSEPEIRSGEEAFAYITELRKLVRYLRICDGNMEEGSMRCDANISVRKKGETKLGTKVEVKNLNSIRNVKRAIEFEAERLIGILEKGDEVQQQTRSFDADKGTTFPLRTKEEANDYRYFTDPDIPCFVVTDELLEKVKGSIPELPEQVVKRFMKDFQLSEYDSRQLAEDKSTSSFFEKIIEHTKNYKAAANWMLGPVRSYLNDTVNEIENFVVGPEAIATIINLIDQGKINFSVASGKLLPELIRDPNTSVGDLISDLNLTQTSEADVVMQWVNEALSNLPDKVVEYKKGKKGLLGLFVGEVKKISKGKADPKIVNELLIEKLNQ